MDHTGLSAKIKKVVPDYMTMGERGMADMQEMEMPLPENTTPMMTGRGPMGPLEMGGMFSVVKVRADQPPGDYRDPGWFKHPPGTVAHEVVGEVAAGAPEIRRPASAEFQNDASLKAKKPTNHSTSH